MFPFPGDAPDGWVLFDDGERVADTDDLEIKHCVPEWTKHPAANRHNYSREHGRVREVRIYVDSLFRCPDMERLMEVSPCSTGLLRSVPSPRPTACELTREEQALVCHLESGLGLWLDKCPDWATARRDEANHSGLYGALGDVVRLLRKKGWKVREDQGVVQSIRSGYRHGVNPRSGLECRVELGGRHLGVHFYQSTQGITHSHGGRFQYDVFARMTYLQQVETLSLSRKIVDLFVELYQCSVSEYQGRLGLPGTPLRSDTFVEWLRKRYASSCHYEPELGRARYTNGDRCRQPLGRVGPLLEHGATGWTMDHGRWVRGELFYDLNDIWIVKTSEHSSLFRSCWEITTIPKNLRGRRVPRVKQIERLKGLHAAAAKDERWSDASRFAAILGQFDERVPDGS